MLSIEKQILFLLSRSKGMDAQDLIRIYEKRSYSPPYIRNAISRLKKEGYVTSPSRSFYEITEPGRSFIQSINRKPLLYDQHWDGRWHVVMVEIPETERKKRDQFRADILQTGFGLLYNSVYIAPWDYSDEAAQLIRKHGIADATVFQGEILHRSIKPEEAASIWQLDAVTAKYEEKRAWFVHDFQPQLARLLPSGAGPEPGPLPDELEAFLLYLSLGEAVSELYLIDPMLPEELLPAEWCGKSILQELRSSVETLVNLIPAGSFYRQFL